MDLDKRDKEMAELKEKLENAVNVEIEQLRSHVKQLKNEVKSV